MLKAKFIAKKELKTWGILLGLSLILMVFDNFGWLNFLKRPVEAFSNSVRKKMYRSWQNFQIRPQISPIVQQQKAESLEIENANLKVKLNTLEQENSSMKKMLGAPLPAKWKFIPANVLSIKNNIMTIDKGKDDGVEKNQTVVFKNILLGRIIKVNPRMAKIILPSHKDSNIKVKILENQEKGVVKSQTGRLLIIDEVLQEVNLVKGQLVVTSGEEEKYPANLIIGKIDKLEKDETAIYQKAVLKPLVDYNNLNNIFIVLN